MERLKENCKPKIVSYCSDYINIDFEYNCELCDNVECQQRKEVNNEG